jgi:hypothetical protein
MKLFFLKIFLGFGILNLMCTTKVSEWVLLNAPPVEYSLVYYHSLPISETAGMQNTILAEKISPANIRLSDAEKKDASEPYYALYYGDRLFKTYRTPSEMADLTTSPLRKKIASELMSGKLCVMLYLTTGNKELDDKGMKEIETALSDSPFRDIITLIPLSRTSAGEAQFTNMLLNVEGDLKTLPQPMLFGIFARFKALEPLVGKGITSENVNLMVSFLTADCSCLIKDNLPGTDILFTNKWDNPAPALVNAILDAHPELQHI